MQLTLAFPAESLVQPMTPEAWSFLALGAAYLVGSVPFALLLGFALGVDIRKTGSGNVGATNLSRARGRKWGIVAFLLDFSKGLLPVLASRWLVNAHGAREPGAAGSLPILAGLASILGHIFPIYLGFRGGKGVATTFGVMAGLAWLATLAAGCVWLALYLPTRTVSIASIAAALALPVTVYWLERGRAGGGLLLGFAVAMSALVIWRHRSNIARLLRGEEHSFGARK